MLSSMNIRKKTVLILSVFILLPFFMLGQKSKPQGKGISIEPKGLTLITYIGDFRGGYDTDYEKEENTHILGINLETNYFFNNTFAVGLGLGYEKINQPEFSYIPIYLNLIGNLDEEFYINFQFGAHKGDVDHSGFLFRGGLGYRVPIIHLLRANFILVYSFQNMYKSFENSGRPENYYNFTSVGIAVSLKIN